MIKFDVIDEIISNILMELNKEHSEYQRLFQKINEVKDLNAKHAHRRMVELCERIRDEIKQRK